MMASREATEGLSNLLIHPNMFSNYDENVTFDELTLGLPDDSYIFYLDGVALTFVSTVGILGSLMSIVVLLKPRIRDFFSTFLTALSIFDSIFLLVAILYIGLPAISEWFGIHIYADIVPICHGILHIARTGSVYVTMAVTIERYFAIVHPLKQFKLKKALLPMAVTFAITYNLPKFFEMETCDFVIGNLVQKDVRKTALRKNPYYATYYVFWSKVVFMEFIPYTFLLVLNGFILSKIWRSYQFRRQFLRTEKRPNSSEEDGEEEPILTPKVATRMVMLKQARSSVTTVIAIKNEEMSERQKRQAISQLNLNTISSSRPSATVAQNSLLKPHEIDLAITLVAISLLFIICQSIKVIPDIYEMLECDHFQLAQEENEMDQMCQISSVFIDYLICLGNLFCVVNSAGNFLFYLLRGKKFRDAFCYTYFCKSHLRAYRPSSPYGGASMQSMHDPNNTRLVTLRPSYGTRQQGVFM